MSEQQGPFHRKGEPGGPGFPVGVLPITGTDQSGATVAGNLLDAGPESSEVELLRTVMSRLGIQWGHDDFGWWAVVQDMEFPSWAVWRQDDSGNEFLVEANLPQSQAEALVAEFEAKGHKQCYTCRDVRQS